LSVRVRKWSTLLFSVTLWAGALLFAFRAFSYVWDARLVVPIQDEWDFLNWYSKAVDTEVSLTGLWQDHNGHRVLIPRMLFLARDALLGGEPLSLILACQLLQVLLIGVIVTVLVREPRLKGTLEQPLLVANTILLLTWTIQTENFHWGLQIAYVLAAFLAVTALALLSCLPPPRVGIDWPSIGAAASALLACLCLGAGIGAWPALLVVAAAQRRGVDAFAAITAGAGLSAMLYLGAAGIDVLLILERWVDVLRFLCRYVGPPYIRETYAVAIGAALIGTGVLAITIGLWRGVRGHLANLALGLVTFGLSVALLTSVVRFGGELAYNRYAAFASLVWVGGLVLAGLVARASRRRMGRWAFSSMVLAMILRFPVGTQGVAAAPFIERAEGSTAAVLSMVAGVPDESAIRAYLYPRPELPQRLLPFLLAHQYGFFGDRLVKSIGRPAAANFHIESSACEASVNLRFRFPGWQVQGRFIGDRSTEWLVFVGPHGNVRGLAVQSRGRDTSFTGYVPGTALGGTVYGVHGDVLCWAAVLQAPG
jgi:hypothetical protein